jgi:hypothetical protein
LSARANAVRVVNLARNFSAQHEKQWLVYKDFDGARSARVATALPDNTVLLILRRNIWHRFTSQVKIGEGCSKFVGKSAAATECEVDLPIADFFTESNPRSNFYMEAAVLELQRRAELGLRPFAPELPVAVIDYEEAGGLPADELKDLLARRIDVATRLASSSPEAALCWAPYPLRGVTAAHYAVQDKSGPLSSKISNYAELEQFWQAGTRLKFCSEAMRRFYNGSSWLSDAKQLDDSVRHCATSRFVDLPPSNVGSAENGGSDTAGTAAPPPSRTDAGKGASKRKGKHGPSTAKGDA